MSWLSIVGIAVALAMDAFAVALAAGLKLPRVTGRHVFRMAWHFGFFQFMMPVLGWFAGSAVAEYIAAWDHWAAFALLSIVGVKMLYEAVCEHTPDAKTDPTRGLTLVMLSVATSIDALAVGLSLAFLEVSIWLPSVIIGVVAGAFTVLGIHFGSRLGARWQRRAEAAGGIVLLLIGGRILLSHFAG